MFPNKQWLLGGLKKLIHKIDDTGKDLPWVIAHVLHNLYSGETDFKLMWLHPEDSLNTLWKLLFLAFYTWIFTLMLSELCNRPNCW